MSRFRSIVPQVILSLASTAAAASSATPPASAFGQLPVMQRVRMAPNGLLLAWQETDAKQSVIVIYDLTANSTRLVVKWEEGQSLRELRWADDTTLLYELSVTQREPDRTGYRSTFEMLRPIAVDVENGKAQALLMTGDRAWVNRAIFLATNVGKPHTVVMSTLDDMPLPSSASPTRLEGGREHSP